MRHLLWSWLISSLSLLGAAYFLPGFRVEDFQAALVTAAILGIANITIRPLLLLLTLPLNILTLGLFTFVVNAIVLRIGAAFAPGFEVDGWMAAIWGAILVAVLSSVLGWLLGGYERAPKRVKS